MYIHNRIEKQLQSLGRVRMVVLKGRQQGCLDPNTKVLTTDLTWVKIKDLYVGHSLVACDEEMSRTQGRAKCRKMGTAIVEKKWDTYCPAYEITFDDGRKVVCSANHRWLSRKSKVDPRWRSVVGKVPDNRDGLKVGDLVRTITETWGQPTFEDAWFGGMIDGEGSLDYKNRTGADMSISQVEGPVLERMKRHCLERRYGGCVVSGDGPRRSKSGLKPVRVISIGSAKSLFRLFGLSRPTRFIGKEWWEGKKLPRDCWHKIVSIKFLGKKNLVDIQTSTGTYIAEGFVSHNCTTYIQSRYMHRTHFKSHQSAYVLSHHAESTLKIFGMTAKFYNNLPPSIKLPLSRFTEKALTVDNGSSYTVGTAGSAQIGRGMTVQLFHGSEVGFYENADELSTGLLQTVADVAGTEMIFESTANGPGNFFYNMCMGAVSGKNGFEIIFTPWYWQDEYKAPLPLSEAEIDADERNYYAAHKEEGLTLYHLAWRRQKIATLGGKVWKFQQEYPFTIDEAFVKAENRFFDLGMVYAARKRKPDISYVAPLILGVDQGRTGDDTKIRRRIGTALMPVETIPSDDGTERDMRLAGRLATIIEREKPDKIFIDTTNEHGALDRLHELGYKKIVKGIHFGEKALDPKRHRNKRTEMYFNLREWFLDPLCSIPPDEQRFLSEIGAIPEEKETSNSVKYLVSKEEIKKELTWSPDELDATALTFAYPVRKAQRPNDQPANRFQKTKRKWESKLSTLRGVGN